MSARQSSTLLVGPFKNAGREWLPEGQPEQVRVHDFIDPDLGRANPYGVYDIGAKAGSASARTTTPRRSPCRRSGAGGSRWADRATRRPAS